MSAWLEASVQERVGNFRLDVEFELDREIGVLFGPSGSGKSLTLRCLAGLRKVREGRVVLGGRVLLDSALGLCEPPQRRKLGFVFQDLALFPHLTVLENVLFGCERRKSPQSLSKARKWLSRVRLEAFESRYPSQLSGGQKQRVAIARSLINGPLLVLADEPTGNLDRESAEQVLSLMREMNRQDGVTFLICTHDEHVASQCSRRIVLVDGRVGSESSSSNL